MKSLYLIVVCFLGSLMGEAQKVSIIPEPVSVLPLQGAFILKTGDYIEISGQDTGLEKVAHYFSEKIAQSTGITLPIVKTLNHGKNDRISFALTEDTLNGPEGYELNVSPRQILIKASTPAGLFYGVQSLFQLFPPEIESKSVITGLQWKVPAVSIIDRPRFKWRGLMLDVVRHFFTVPEVKGFIDEMVRFKFNMLHLHLSDDQGWRLQIDSLPMLTQIGAWRPKREGKWGNTPAPDSSEPKNYGGYYTHHDIRELIQYAADRFVSIMPEIDVPGHSMAAIASYPELSCTPGAYHVNIGDKLIDWQGGGKFEALFDNCLCPSKENVYVFLNKVFTEVASLFTFEYIHMGGDEAAKNFWAKSDTVRALMRDQGLNSLDEVQSYFVHKVQEIINSKGKKMMGWDEIMEGGLPGNAAVMSWRGQKGGIIAAGKGHKVVMTPNDFVYVDLMQGDPIIEPKVYSTVRLKQTYKFDPLPPGVDENMILGGQGNLWTEHIPHMRAAQYMLWPRGMAIAESVWSPVSNKNWNKFVEKVENEFIRLDIRKVKYARSMYDPIFTVSKDGENLFVKLETELNNLDIHYSFDETNPDQFYPVYTNALLVPKDAVTLKVVTVRNGKIIGRQLNMPIDELKKRIKK